jgi:serine protease Do
VGLEIQELTPELKVHFKLPGGLKGVLVSDVIERSPAAKAGIKRGDILLDMEGMPISSPEDYRQNLAEFTPSDPINITIHHKGEDQSVRVQLSTFPSDLALDLVYQRLGIKVGELDRATRRQYDLEGGMMIEQVRRDSEAGRIGLERGDLVLKINDVPIRNLEEFKETISRFHYLPSLTLIVQRGPYGYSLTLPF